MWTAALSGVPPDRPPSWPTHPNLNPPPHSFETLQVHAGAPPVPRRHRRRHRLRMHVCSLVGVGYPHTSPPPTFYYIPTHIIAPLHQGTTRTRTRWRGPYPSTRPPPSSSGTTSTGPASSPCRSLGTCAWAGGGWKGWVGVGGVAWVGSCGALCGCRSRERMGASVRFVSPSADALPIHSSIHRLPSPQV